MRNSLVQEAEYSARLILSQMLRNRTGSLPIAQRILDPAQCKCQLFQGYYQLSSLSVAIVLKDLIVAANPTFNSDPVRDLLIANPTYKLFFVGEITVQLMTASTTQQNLLLDGRIVGNVSSNTGVAVGTVLRSLPVAFDTFNPVGTNGAVIRVNFFGNLLTCPP
jgi:hypothetical protein